MSLVDLINTLLRLLELAIFLRVVLSWIPGALDTPAGHAIHRLTSPILAPLRRVVPPVAGVDFSPFVAILLLEIIKPILFRLLR